MAKRVVYVDDVTGKEINEGEGGPVRFSLQGEYYELDISKETLAKLEKALKPYMDVATAVEAPPPVPTRVASPRRSTGSTRSATGSGLSKDQLDAIRTWANANGFEVSPRGRIAANVIAAFDEAHKS